MCVANKKLEASTKNLEHQIGKLVKHIKTNCCIHRQHPPKSERTLQSNQNGWYGK